MEPKSQQEISDILRGTVEEYLLGDSYYSTFGDSGNTFFALRYLSPLLDENGEPLWYLRNLQFYSSKFNIEKWDTAWRGEGWIAMGGDGKSLEEKIKENDFQAALVQFRGIFYNNRWWVEHSFHFLGTHIPADEARKEEEDRLKMNFQEYEATLLKEKQHAALPDEDSYFFRKYGYLPSMLYHQALDREEEQNDRFMRFVRTTYVDPFVSAFRYYMLPVIEPVSSLYSSFLSLISSDFRFYLFSIQSAASSEQLHNRFFLVDCFSGLVYQWKYWPIIVTHSRDNPFEQMFAQFSTIIPDFDSRLLQGLYALDSDDLFWRDYVLAAQNGRMKYLVPAWKKATDEWLLSK